MNSFRQFRPLKSKIGTLWSSINPTEKPPHLYMEQFILNAEVVLKLSPRCPGKKTLALGILSREKCSRSRAF